MEYPQLLEAHKGIIYLFIAWMTLKLIMMIIQHKEKFTQFRDKTKVIEMILGSLILISGIWLFIKSPAINEGWLHAKITLAMLGIPLAIVGFKKYKVALVASALAIFLYVFWIATFKGFI
jgi:uncharacterized membrane protein SirB2